MYLICYLIGFPVESLWLLGNFVKPRLGTKKPRYFLGVFYF